MLLLNVFQMFIFINVIIILIILFNDSNKPCHPIFVIETPDLHYDYNKKVNEIGPSSLAKTLKKYKFRLCPSIVDTPDLHYDKKVNEIGPASLAETLIKPTFRLCPIIEEKHELTYKVFLQIEVVPR